MTKGKIDYWLGHRVAYSRAFLRSTAQYTGIVPMARGKVIEVEEVCPDFVLATIQWEARRMLFDGLPTRVNVANLVRTDRLHLETQ
jgi:hypothetical protein